jgi:hypothetical protein
MRKRFFMVGLGTSTLRVAGSESQTSDMLRGHVGVSVAFIDILASVAYDSDVSVVQRPEKVMVALQLASNH